MGALSHHSGCGGASHLEHTEFQKLPDDLHLIPRYKALHAWPPLHGSAMMAGHGDHVCTGWKHMGYGLILFVNSAYTHLIARLHPASHL